MTDITILAIPESDIRIRELAFANCTGLRSITCDAITPPICDDYVFYNVEKSIPLYIPAGREYAYQIAKGWQDFTNIQTLH